MSCRCGATFLTPILAIAGLVAAGAAGYRVLSGGCGSCSKEQNAVVVSTTTKEAGQCGLCPGESKECDSSVVAASEEGCCASKAAVKTVAAEAKSECCQAKDGSNVKTVAAEAKKEGCCSEGQTEAKECTGSQGCEGEAKGGCCGGGKKQEKKEVATSGK